MIGRDKMRLNPLLTIIEDCPNSLILIPTLICMSNVPEMKNCHQIHMVEGIQLPNTETKSSGHTLRSQTLNPF